jgi:membrane protein implicated in regulation of membrane protease activity
VAGTAVIREGAGNEPYMGSPRLLIVLLAATVVVVAAVVLLLTRSWVALGAVMALHALGAAVVVAYALRRVDQSQDKPDPVVEARLEEERRSTAHAA